MVTVTMNKAARLANQMFMYAMVRSVAEKNGYNFWIDPEMWYGYGLFNCDLGKKDGGLRHTCMDLEGQKFNPNVFNVEDFTNFVGYFQCERYFDREKVKEWFEPIVPQPAIDFMREFPKDEYCYINVRGTDQHISHLTLPAEYYEQAICIMLGFNFNLKFVVITDDIDLSKWYFPDYPVYSNDRNTDFCLLNQSTFLIGAISTFAWWAGYLNDYNVVIMPKYFYHHKTQGVEGYTGYGPRDIHTHKFIWI